MGSGGKSNEGNGRGVEVWVTRYVGGRLSRRGGKRKEMGRDWHRVG